MGTLDGFVLITTTCPMRVLNSCYLLIELQSATGPLRAIYQGPRQKQTSTCRKRHDAILIMMRDAASICSSARSSIFVLELSKPWNLKPVLRTSQVPPAVGETAAFCSRRHAARLRRWPTVLCSTAIIAVARYDTICICICISARDRRVLLQTSAGSDGLVRDIDMAFTRTASRG